MNLIVVPAVMCLLAGLMFFLLSYRKKSINSKGWNRGDYLKRIEKIDTAYQKKNNNKIRFEYAQRLFKVGEFSKSQELLQPLLAGVKPPADATYMAAHIEYLRGHYGQAEKMLESLAANAPVVKRIKAQIGLVFVYYQSNQYSKARNLFKGFEGKIQLALWEMMKGFGDKKPNQIDWKGTNRSIIPFVAADPLPVISVAINNQQINVFLDTGAEAFYLDETIASSLGIQSIARQIEPYAGGKTIEVGYGRADSLNIGDVLVQSVPVKIGPIQRFSAIFDKPIGGILSTGVLHQFLSTIDYPEGRLILRQKNEKSRNALKKEFEQDTTTELPFVLGLTHFMICKGGINDKDALNIFLDSGLAHSTAALLLPKETLEYVGIPVPATETIPENKGGLAGGGFPVGSFTAEKFRLGPLHQDHVAGLYGIFPPQLYHACEFIIDGIISHQFLKKYKWTIDFDSMKMLFSQ